MNKFFKSLIILMLLALTAGGGAEAYETSAPVGGSAQGLVRPTSPSNGYGLMSGSSPAARPSHTTSILKKSELEKIIVNEVIAQSKKQLQKFGKFEVEVKVINLPVEEVIKTVQKPTIKLASNFDKFMQYDIKKVTIIDGTNSRSFPVNVKVAVYKDVLTAREFIPQFQLVNQSNTYIKKLDVASSIENTFESLNTVLVASKNISKDMPVLTTQTRQKPDIVRNSDVKIFFTQGDELSIELEGIAIKEGRVGDVITVKNTKYNKIYTATVVGENRVEVKL